MKWIRRVLISAVIVVCGLATYVMLTALHAERPVGFQVVQTSDSSGQAVAIGVWYPTQESVRPTTLLGLQVMRVAPNATISGQALPLIVISHGNGGGPGSHADLALALASAGYVVAAPLHTGDNYADQSAVGSLSWLNVRTRELHATVDYMLKDWQGHNQINPERIGAFGFSAGGFTVLTSVGAQPDLHLIAKHCSESTEFACDVLRSVKSPLLDTAQAKTGEAFLSDARIKAVVVAAPGLGFTMPADGLTKVEVPIQLWSGDNDVNVPYATNSKPIREALGARVEFHGVPGAGHFSFLVPCGLIAPPQLCTDQGQFDRKVFHAQMNAEVIAFFEKNMKMQ